MKCFKCGAEIPAGKMACEKCGAIAFAGSNNIVGNMQENYKNTQKSGVNMSNSNREPIGSGYSVASMVLGIIGLVLFWTFIIGIPAGILATALGGYALYRGASGKGMAIAGLSCGIITLFLCIFIICVVGVNNL
ncbi:MAG: DUF4190 domain-containing protein [Bacillus sp. (in: Bacteria)]|nr:DUF4190 domain-containing protein [Bacillus sp. (in: firmicutes)]MCM1426438.1 DUF4190 domain-containing protein [Eubacterium sp.]